MQLIPGIVDRASALTEVRRDLHAHPEIGFQEHRTAARVAELLTQWGIDVHRNIGGTGVVGVIRGASPGRSVGLRADMDALPMDEATGLPHASRYKGAFHGCGHDGHTAMLLGAAQHLASTRAFAGTVYAIFQPAEEGLGGAAAMIAADLFTRFPCDEIYALHNWPNAPIGRVSLCRGAALAASDQFDIAITGRGAHGAQPQHAVDPVMVAVALAQALQTIISRNVDPLASAAISITQIHAGSAYNVIPETAHLGGTIRTFEDPVRAMVFERIEALATSIAAGFSASVKTEITPGFPVLRNSDVQAEAAMMIAREVVGAARAEYDTLPKTGSEDFAEMLKIVPGAFLFLGQGAGPALHNPQYDFNDEVLPIGASLLARIAERRLG